MRLKLGRFDPRRGRTETQTTGGKNANNRGISRWAWRNDYGNDDDVIGVQHAKKASWEEEKNGKRVDKMKDDGREIRDGRKNVRVPFASLRQDADQPTRRTFRKDLWTSLCPIWSVWWQYLQECNVAWTWKLTTYLFTGLYSMFVKPAVLDSRMSLCAITSYSLDLDTRQVRDHLGTV
jgi:hypothetical protein